MSVPLESSGFLKGCLVDGDAEQRTRERRVRRRALVISVALQSAVLAAVILVPLFGKPAYVAFAKVMMPPPPYGTRHESKPVTDRTEPRKSRPRQNICRFCAPPTIPGYIVMHDPPSDGHDGDDTPFMPDGSSIGEIPIVDSRNGPKIPHHDDRVEKPTIVHRTRLDPAMLVHRVEPVYPTLPKQLGRGGRVELRAIIATDGTIQSLQVVGGDPLFYQSAMDAVRQWRYTPTVLNGQPVEIDTYISVIYTMQR